MLKNLFKVSILCSATLFCSCNPPNNEPNTPKGEPTNNEVAGFYLLNEGVLSTNNAAIDYYDYRTAVYSQNFFSAVNPSVTGGLGDVGNDIKIYGNRLYAVINASNLVEVMDAKTAKHIGKISVPNCRYIAFHGDKAYISSFAGATISNGTQLGYVVEADTATLQVTRNLEVGYQPEGLAVAKGKLYVANSGGYNYPNYDNRLSIIDIQSFTEIKKIEVALNLFTVEKDENEDIYVLSNGNYFDVLPDIYKIDTQNDIVAGNLGIEYATNFYICGDSLYAVGNNTNWETGINIAYFYIYNLNTQKINSDNFIVDGTQISKPYGIAVNPLTKDILVTDVKDYVLPGEVFCFSSVGTKKWNASTGIIPSKIAFLKKTVDED
jgi:hypothetical protein